MPRKLIDITLFVSFLAMSTSGMMMFVIEKPSFSIQMHPVHKLFGLVMIAAVIGHLAYNYKMLFHYLKTTAVAVFGGVLVVLLVVLYGVALNNQLPAEIAEPMDALAAQAEAAE
ncbi:MAG: DUF4405 domain-containing protein [Immundisolibacteraceae bacterium]|jgi:glycerol-3-phosphate acyltransferase PlsY|nr:DUF4405 domain-containing protein [Immundisolibacteraceae bacterium]